MTAKPLERRSSFLLWGLAVVLADIAAYVAVTAAKIRWSDAGVPPATMPVQFILAGAFIITGLLTTTWLWSYRETIRRGGPVFAVTLALLAVLPWSFALLGQPLGSVDNYWNTLMSRGWTVYGRNPYLTTPMNLAADPLFPLTAAVWHGASMIYGPLWTLAAGLPTYLFRQPRAATLSLKFLVSLAYVAAGLLLAKYLRRRRNPNANIFLAAWLLNPLAIFEVANAGHNEGLLVLALAAAAIGLDAKKPAWALPGIVGAALIKIWPAALLPVLLGIKQAPRRAWWTAVGLSTALTSSFAFFWSGGRIFSSLLHRVEVFSPEHLSPGFFFLLQIASSLSRRPEPNLSTANITAGLILATVCLIAGILAAKGKIRLLPASGLITGVFVFICLSWPQPWYLLTFLPFCLPRPDEAGAKRLLAVHAGLATVAFAAYAVAWTWLAAIAGVGFLIWQATRPKTAARPMPAGPNV